MKNPKGNIFANRKLFNKPIIKAAYKWAEKCYPNESVGFVVKSGDKIKFQPAENIHENPTNNFRIAANQVPWDSMMALIHNHPEGNLRPSRNDMELYKSIKKPMGIFISHKSEHEISHSDLVWYDPEYSGYPYEGRPFINGICDCYSLIRDFYRVEYGITLRDYPRDQDWFNPDYFEKLNLYEDYFAEEGFEEITDTPKRGDIFLMKIYLGRYVGPINHGAIYLGDEKILHHLQGRLSSIDNAAKWVNRYLAKTIRRKLL